LQEAKKCHFVTNNKFVTLSACVNRHEHPPAEKIKWGGTERKKDWKPGAFVKIDGTSTGASGNESKAVDITHQNP
jgi:hypothetical protein